MKTRYNSFAEIEERLKILGLHRQVEMERMKLHMALIRKRLGFSLWRDKLPMILLARLYRTIRHR